MTQFLNECRIAACGCIKNRTPNKFKQSSFWTKCCCCWRCTEETIIVFGWTNLFIVQTLFIIWSSSPFFRCCSPKKVQMFLSSLARNTNTRQKYTKTLHFYCQWQRKIVKISIFHVNCCDFSSFVSFFCVFCVECLWRRP